MPSVVLRPRVSVIGLGKLGEPMAAEVAVKVRCDLV